ncbi:hypothetical protein [Streptomyces sp. HNM0645]|uniref:hypothetical protein n=1 Tax=Streptomyces sp. HNM0645 TaxID=2782343 RepID=UPI0032D56E91
MIHEPTEAHTAERYWADLVGADVATFGKTALKRHDPKTVRKNVCTHHRGCLVIQVRQSAEQYRRIEGRRYGIVGAASATDPASRT